MQVRRRRGGRGARAYGRAWRVCRCRVEQGDRHKASGRPAAAAPLSLTSTVSSAIACRPPNPNARPTAEGGGGAGGGHGAPGRVAARDGGARWHAAVVLWRPPPCRSARGGTQPCRCLASHPGRAAAARACSSLPLSPVHHTITRLLSVLILHRRRASCWKRWLPQWSACGERSGVRRWGCQLDSCLPLRRRPGYCVRCGSLLGCCKPVVTSILNSCA